MGGFLLQEQSLRTIINASPVSVVFDVGLYGTQYRARLTSSFCGIVCHIQNIILLIPTTKKSLLAWGFRVLSVGARVGSIIGAQSLGTLFHRTDSVLVAGR